MVEACDQCKQLKERNTASELLVQRTTPLRCRLWRMTKKKLQLHIRWEPVHTGDVGILSLMSSQTWEHVWKHSIDGGGELSRWAIGRKTSSVQRYRVCKERTHRVNKLFASSGQAWSIFQELIPFCRSRLILGYSYELQSAVPALRALDLQQLKALFVIVWIDATCVTCSPWSGVCLSVCLNIINTMVIIGIIIVITGASTTITTSGEETTVDIFPEQTEARGLWSRMRWVRLLEDSFGAGSKCGSGHARFGESDGHLV